MDQPVHKLKKQIVTKIRLKELEDRRKQLQIEQRVLEIEQRRLEIKQMDEERTELQTQIADLIEQLNQLPIGINRLPTEILLTIFEHLELLDVLRCRQVCRQWHATIELMRLDSLVIFEKRLETGRYGRWPYSLEAIDPKRSINVAKLNPQLNRTGSPFLFGLRRLKVQGALKDDLQSAFIELINRLGALEELYMWELKNDDKEIAIRSNSLIYLGICFASRGKPIIIDTPKLRKFMIISGLQNLKFVYPNQITELELASSLSERLQVVSQFTGVQLLSCACRLERSDLKALGSLREIRFCNSLYGGTPQTMKQNALELLQLKRELNHGDLRIVFRGIVLEDAGQLDGYDSAEDNLFELLMSNYNKLASGQLDWVDHLDFSLLNRWISGAGLPEDFHTKFSALRQVNITDHIDNNLIQFLKKCKKFRSLFVTYSSLRAFHNQLEIIPSFVEILAIERKQQPDFHFILNFCKLKPAEFGRETALDVVQVAWQTIEKVQAIIFRLEPKHFRIEREQTNQFVLRIDHDHYKTFEHLEALIRFLDSYSF